MVLVTPLVDIGSDQVEYIKASQALGIRSGLCVHSWDNLTNKGLIRIIPDRVFVWNETQRREAVTMHGVAPGPGDRDRRAGLRPVVRAPAEHDARGVLPQGRPARRQAVLPVSLFVAVHRAGRVASSSTSGCAPCGQAPDPRVQAGRHPDPAASGEPAAVAALRLLRAPGRRAVAARRRQPGGSGVEERLLRLDVSLGRRGRDQHQRADRVRESSAVRCSRCACPSTQARRKARCTSTTC